VSVDQSELISAARDLLERPDPTTAGIWPRASALLTRQALESTLDELWRQRAQGLEFCSAKAQLICLPVFLGDPEFAGHVSYAWAGLSRACHQQPYDLPPTSVELLDWIGTVERLIERVRSISADKPSPNRTRS
jgi:hypothetical protein